MSPKLLSAEAGYEKPVSCNPGKSKNLISCAVFLLENSVLCYIVSCAIQSLEKALQQRGEMDREIATYSDTSSCNDFI